MGLHEWSVGGVLLSPFLIYAVLALLLTGLLRWLLQRVGFTRWIWHEALFDFALFICVLAAVVAVLGH
ncbi:putative Protein AaeX [Pseudomonas marincola]|jgi:hypothetical protein|uniref:Transporter n=1 Tax=Pseudomonas marincola TaxID=437900 RepID=A0A1I7D0G3_9PSED|nr:MULTISPECIES: DUF1656 domain-containing protein [Pseudomonas]MAB98853.1 DUF1656 domain-containing protein [Pseudomonadaceae bacterium]NRH29809.1 DUF1656 domain-containing protein [Pseudomonas sp. MS19]OEO23865.1 transporter [Pseudomonas sp. J237]CAE6902815.1 putative Protein AaeX [Pseudomonas marincola]SFU05164.1 Protein of unknown function [Pseudomonas marincola]